MTTPDQPAKPNSRLRQSIWDMVRSLGVVLAVVAVILIITLRPQPDPVKVVDPLGPLTQARIEASYDVLYPDGLIDEGPDAGWRPTSARWEATPASLPDPAWHVGFVTPAGAYAQVGQSATTQADYVEEQTSQGRPVDCPVATAYQCLDNRKGTRSLVAVRDGVTIVVSGTADWPVLVDLASRLSPTAVPPA